MHMQTDIKNYNNINRIIWISIFMVMIFLTFVIFMLDHLNVFEPIPGMLKIGEILFIVAIVVGFAILILKRTVFRLESIITKASTTNTREEGEIFLLQQIRRNYIVLWILSEMIGMMGFLYYVFTMSFINYLLFMVISIYSLAINYPREAMTTTCLENLRQAGRTE